MALLTGEEANVMFGSSHKQETLFGVSDFSLSFNRGTIEQELVGTVGNIFTPGALSVEGSFTNCRFGASGNSDFIDSLINGTYVKISGQINTGAGNDLKFVFASCQITGYDVSIGDATTISEASIDFTVLDPYNVTYATQKVND